MSNPEDLNPELEAALAAELTDTVPAPGPGYWDKIDASLAAKARSVSATPTAVNEPAHAAPEETGRQVPAAAAVTTNSRGARLKKSMLGSAAGLLVLAVGGLAFLQLGGSDSDSIGSDFASVGDESFEASGAESAPALNSAEADLDSVESQAADGEALTSEALNSVDGAVEESAVDGLAVPEVGESGSAGGDPVLNPLDALPWLAELEAGRVLVEVEQLGFAESDIASAGGQVGPVDIFLYRFVAADDDTVAIVLSGEVADITFDVYDDANTQLASTQILNEIDVEAGREYFIVVTSAADVTFEFELSISRI